jgi:hypothetical protein
MPGFTSFPQTPFHSQTYYRNDYRDTEGERESIFSRQVDPIIIRNPSRTSRYPFINSLPMYTPIPSDTEPEQRSFFRRFFLCCW